MALAKSFSNEMWLIQIRALRKKLQLTLRRKGVSEKEKEMWRGRQGQGVGAGTGTVGMARHSHHRAPSGRWRALPILTESLQFSSWILVLRKGLMEALQPGLGLLATSSSSQGGEVVTSSLGLFASLCHFFICFSPFCALSLEKT